MKAPQPVIPRALEDAVVAAVTESNGEPEVEALHSTQLDRVTTKEKRYDAKLREENKEARRKAANKKTSPTMVFSILFRCGLTLCLVLYFALLISCEMLYRICTVQ